MKPTIEQQIEVVEKAYQLIRDKNNWTQGTFARDNQGFAVWPQEQEACKFCAIGAIQRFTDDTDDNNPYVNEFLNNPYVNEFLNFTLDLRGDRASSINDYEGHEAVMELYQNFIAHLKQQVENEIHT